LGDCAARPEMTGSVRSDDPASLVASCETERGAAYPPTRLLQFAQNLGAAAFVASICRSNWGGPLGAVFERLGEALDALQCLAGPAPFRATDCTADCSLVEVLSDARRCPEDPACPAGGRCPAAAVEDLAWGEPGACRGPEGRACYPLKRDLGVHPRPDGEPVRWCLVRQATRGFLPGAGRCTDPVNDGWSYVPPEWNAAGGSCALASLAGVDGTPILEDDSTAFLRCRLDD
jgi:hypothetical protein